MPATMSRDSAVAGHEDIGGEAGQQDHHEPDDEVVRIAYLFMG